MRPADQAESERKRPSDQPSAQRERKREDRPIGADGPERGQKPSRRVAEAVLPESEGKRAGDAPKASVTRTKREKKQAPPGSPGGAFRVQRNFLEKCKMGLTWSVKYAILVS